MASTARRACGKDPSKARGMSPAAGLGYHGRPSAGSLPPPPQPHAAQQFQIDQRAQIGVGCTPWGLKVSTVSGRVPQRPSRFRSRRGAHSLARHVAEHFAIPASRRERRRARSQPSRAVGDGAEHLCQAEIALQIVADPCSTAPRVRVDQPVIGKLTNGKG